MAGHVSVAKKLSKAVVVAIVCLVLALCGELTCPSSYKMDKRDIVARGRQPKGRELGLTISGRSSLEEGVT